MPRKIGHRAERYKIEKEKSAVDRLKLRSAGAVKNISAFKKVKLAGIGRGRIQRRCPRLLLRGGRRGRRGGRR